MKQIAGLRVVVVEVGGKESPIAENGSFDSAIGSKPSDGLQQLMNIALRTGQYPGNISTRVERPAGVAGKDAIDDGTSAGRYGDARRLSRPKN